MSFRQTMLQRVGKRYSRRQRRLAIQALEDRRLLAAQVITAIPSADSVIFEDTFTVDLQYSVTDPLPSGPVLFGLHVHYDSSEIEFVSQSNVLPDGLIAVQDRAETVSDNDPNTDRIWTVSFVDVVNGFPFPATQLPASLATLQFRALRQAGNTPLNFTANTSFGYDFQGPSIVINVTPPTFTVTSSDDTPTAGELTLRQAISLANSLNEPAIINFDPSVSNISITGGELIIANDVSLIGLRADQLVISASNNSRVFTVESGNTVTMSGLALIGGNANAEDGGAILNQGVLQLDAVRVTGNIAGGAGGAIANLGTLSILNSELSENEANGGNGGAIFSSGSLTVINSTLSGNSTLTNGGGIASSGSAVLRNTTIVLNRATGAGAGIFRTAGSFIARNSIVSGNTIASVVQDVTGVIDSGNSLIGGVLNQILVPTLAFDGAPTRSHRLVQSGPAVDQGSNADATNASGAMLLKDQRGRSRVFGSAVDLGAVEFLPAPGVTVTLPQGTMIDEGASKQLSVVLNSPPSATVVIALTSNDVTEILPRFARVTFGPGNWNVPQLVPIDAPDDNEFDGDKTSTVMVSIVDADSDDTYDAVPTQSFAFTTIDDEGLGIIVTPVGNLNTTEDGGTVTFTVVLDKAPTETVTVGLSSSDLSEGTVSTNTLTFTPENFAQPQTVTVTGIDDFLVDGTTNYSVVIAAAVSQDQLYNGFDPADVDVSNLDNDTAGFNITPLSGMNTTEAGGTATFTVALNSLPSANVTVEISSDDTSEGTVSTSLLTFTPSDAMIPKTVTVTGVDDQIDDGVVFYKIVTATASSSDANYNGIDPEDVTLTNTDDDTAGITVSPVSGLSTSEAGGTATFTVVLDTVPLADVSIPIVSGNANEGTVSPSLLTFTPANARTPQTVVITGVDDGAVADGHLLYTINTGAANSSDANYNGMDPPDVSVTNADNDTVGIIVTPTLGLTTSEDGGTAMFTVALTTLPTSDVLVALTSTNISEGSVSTSLLTFTSTNATTPQSVTVTGIDDGGIVDGAVSFTIVTSAATSSDANYNGFDAPDVVVTNSDNDTAGITVTPVSGLSTSETGGSGTFTIALNSLPSSNVTIAVASENTAEGTVSTSLLTFTPSNATTPQTVTVTGVDDDVADGSVSYSILTAPAVSTDANYNGIDPPNVAVLNSDDDTRGIAVTPVSGLSTSEAGGSATFDVVLESQPTADVVIGLSSSNASEGSVSVSSLKFTPVNWDSEQSVTVTGVNDAVDDGDVTFNIITAVAVGGDYSGIDPADVVITNLDDDTAGFTLSKTEATVAESGTTDTFSVVLTSQPISNVVIGVSSSDPSEASVNTSTLAFDSTNWNVPRVVTITGSDDVFVDGNSISVVTVTVFDLQSDDAFDALIDQTVRVMTTDNDAPGFTMEQTGGSTIVDESGSTDTFTIVLTRQPASDVVIDIVSNDLGEVTVDNARLIFTNVNWGTPQVVTVTGASDSIVDGDQNTTIVLAVNAAASNDAFDLVGDQTLIVTTTDDDVPLDFGDAPTLYPVTIAQDGARHTTSSLRLGNSIDFEIDGQSSVAASGDGSDEDGVTQTASQFTSSAGATQSSYRISASEAGKLDAWIDFNQDGDWSDAGEQIFASVDVVQGNNQLAYTIPAGTLSGDTFARFRLSTAGELAPTGAAADGEVEDYLQTIVDGNSTAGVTIEVVGGSIVLTLDSTDNVIRSGGTELFRALSSLIGSFQINGTASDDTITIDLASGLVLPDGGTNIAGGGGDNRLVLQGAGDIDLTDPRNLVTDVSLIELPSDATNKITVDAAAIGRFSPTEKTIKFTTGATDQIEVIDSANWRMTDPIVVDGRFVLTAKNQNAGGEIIQVDAARPYRNFLQFGDVNNSGGVSAGDALDIIFELNAPRFRDASGTLLDPTELDPLPTVFLDVNGDGKATAADALNVINILFQQSLGDGNAEAEDVVADFVKLAGQGFSIRKVDELIPREVFHDTPVVRNRQSYTNQLVPNRSNATVPYPRHQRSSEAEQVVEHLFANPGFLDELELL